MFYLKHQGGNVWHLTDTTKPELDMIKKSVSSPYIKNLYSHYQPYEYGALKSKLH